MNKILFNEAKKPEIFLKDEKLQNEKSKDVHLD